MSQASETDKAYIAGFLDGEGCITINRQKNKNQWNRQVVITNRNLTVLQWVKSIYGGHITTVSHEGTCWAPAFVLQIGTGRDIRIILKDLMPYLRLKRAQAENMLAFLDFLHCDGEIKKGGNRPHMDAEAFALRQSFEIVQKDLNRKGRAA